MRFRSCWTAIFALCIASQSFAATITVTTAADTAVANDGVVTLREAITAINAGSSADPDIVAQSPGVFGTQDKIQFNIPGAGVHTITALTSLPTITKPVSVNGYSQPGSSANTNALNAGINAVLQIEITCQPGAVGISVSIVAAGTFTVIRGLNVHGCGGDQISISADNVVIAGNFIGTNAAGTAAMPNLGGGFAVRVNSGNGVAIGGSTAADRNLLSGNTQGGVILPFPSTTGHLIQGNYIGPDVTGTLSLGAFTGEGLRNIGGANIVGNLISGNTDGGIGAFSDNTIRGNLIGTQRDGVSPLPNGNFGGIAFDGTKSIVGGAGAGAGNVIAYNQGTGVSQSFASSDNTISQNSMFGNSTEGICLNSAGCLPKLNTAGGAHNYPVVTTASISAGSAAIAGTFNSVAASAYVLEFFSNVSCHAVGYGEGKTFIGQTTVTTDGGGNASFSLTFAVPAGESVFTATATSSTGFTSEFSHCLTASGAPAPTNTAVMSSLNPSTLGQSVTFTATVSGGTAPTGTVQFKDGGANLGAPVTLVGVSATLATSALALGTHPITAIYSGDAGNTASTSPALNQVVNAAALIPTTTTVISSLNPSMLGQSVTFTATVSGGTVPSGTVQFKDGAANLGVPVILVGVSATLTTSTLALGTHPISAIYSGDAGNAASTSTALNQVVNPVVVAPPPVSAPTLSEWALIALTLLVALLGISRFDRRVRSSYRVD
jgi:CSLREA domain-containing protein